MRKNIILMGIIICIVGTFIGIISTFLYADIMKQQLEPNLVDVFRLISVFGFCSFLIGFLLSIIGAVLKKGLPKKTKLISFNRYYNP